MLIDHHLRIATELDERMVESLRPAFRVPDLSTPQRQPIVQHMRHEFCHIHHMELRQIYHEFAWGFHVSAS